MLKVNLVKQLKPKFEIELGKTNLPIDFKLSWMKLDELLE